MQSSSSFEYFQPKIIKKLKQQHLKYLRQLPDWEQIEILVDSIQNNTITQQDLQNLNQQDIIALLIEDLFGYDFTYHLIVNHQFELFINVLKQTKQLSQNQLSKLLSSLFKGIIKIKKQNNYKLILNFIKQIEEIFVYYEKSIFQDIKLNIVVESHFNYKKNIWESKLLLAIIQGLINDKDQLVVKLQEKIQELKFRKFLNSTTEERNQQNHLKWKKYLMNKEYIILILQAKFYDILIDEAEPVMFQQDYGHSIYMRMMKQAPFDFLTLYHNKHLDQIKLHLKSQRKCGYNILHCLAENKNPISQEFLEILYSLDLEEEKHQNYFDQIPAVMYLEKTKQINNEFLQFLLGDIPKKDFKELEGAQLIMMIYAQQSFKENIIASQDIKKDYLGKQRRRKFDIKQFKKRRYKGKAQYKKSQSKTIADKKLKNNKVDLNEIKQETLQGYCEVNLIHQIFKQKQINFEFPISQYTLPIGHMNLYLSNIEQSLAETIQNPEILNNFLEYLLNEFCTNINENHKQIIETLISKLNLNITISQLILQRKIMILNSLYQKNQSQKIKDAIQTLLSQNSEFNYPYYSYSSFQDFQQYLYCNDLIQLNQCQNYDPSEWLMNLIRQKHYNKTHLIEIACQIPRIENYPPFNQLIEFYCDQNLIHKFNYYVWFNQNNLAQTLCVNVYRRDIARQLMNSLQGVQLLFSMDKQVEDDRFMYASRYKYYIPKLLFNFNEETIQPFYNNLQSIVDEYPYFNLFKKSFQICNYQENQLKLFFQYQLIGIRLKFIPNKRIQIQNSSCIQEEIVLQQIQQNKSFIQVLLNNDKNGEFLKQSYKHYHPFWDNINKLNYFSEALHFEAYNNLRFLEEQLWLTNDEDQVREESIYQCLFEVFKKENINIYSNGFYVNKKCFKYNEKIFNHYQKIDYIRINRQIKQFFSIFQKLQSHAEKEFEYNFFNSNQISYGPGLYIIKVLLYYLDDENIRLLEKQIIKFLEVAHPLTIVFYYKNTKNVEQTMNFLSNPNINFTSKAILRLAKIVNEEKLMIYLLQYIKESQHENRDKISKILIKKYMKNYNDLKYIKPYFYEEIWTSGDIQQLYLHFLQNDEIRKAEFILLYLDVNEKTISKVQIQLPHSQYHYAQALRTQWNIGLNLQQFKDIIQNNEFSLKQQENALLNIVYNGQYEKLNLILNWIQNEKQLIDLTTVAVQEYVNQFTKQLKSLRPQFNIDKVKFSNKTLSRINSDQKNLFTNRQVTAEILLKRVYDADIDTSKYLDQIVFFQLVFPNPEFKFEDTKKRFLYDSIQIVYGDMFQQNWDKYLQIISQTADFYLEKEFDIGYQCYRKTKFFLQLIQIFYQRLGPNHQGSDIEIALKSLKEYQYRKPTDSLGHEKFSKVLSNKYFQGLSLQQIEINSHMLKIYYGQEFDQNRNSTIEELFISLMSKNRYSINSIMKRLSNLREIVEQNQIIQYLIMHGGEDTIIDVLKILGEENINEFYFYYRDIPLLTYIVFKKQYKLYYFAKKHLIQQWELQPKILDQKINQDIQCLTIHQFAQLNQFYVHFQIPYEIKLISRSCSFIFPNQYNKNLKAFKIYTILSQLFKSTNRRKLEIITLLLECQINQTQESLVETLINCSNFRIAQEILLQTLKCQNTPFAYLLENQKPEQRNLVNGLLEILNSGDQQNLEKQSQDDQLKLWKFLYNKFGLYHPVIEALVRISPNNFAESYILDSPKLSLIVAQTADYQSVLNLTNIQNIETQSLRFVSEHLIKIVLMVQYEQQFDSLLKEEDFQYIHQKFYVDALNQIEINFKGSINNQFMNEMVNLLNIENPSIQLIDNFYEQVRDEPNSLKRAFKLLIKIKEYNSLIEQVKDQAINYTDNLYKKFQIFIGEKFDIIKQEDSAQLYLPFNFDSNELDQFLYKLPCHFKDLYIEAIMKKATKKKGMKKRITLNIKFEEENLSPLYNDIRYLVNLLWEQQQPKDLLDYSNQFKIKGWQELQKKNNDENTFIYTTKASNNIDWIRGMFQYEPEQSEYFYKYQNSILVFFNSKVVFNQAQIQKLIQESLTTLIKQITVKNKDIKVEIKLESYFEVFFMNEDIQNVYKDPLALIDGILNWRTLNNILIYMIQCISEIIQLFELNENKQIVIVFSKTENEGTTFKSNIIDDYVSFCNPEIQYSDKSLIINIPISSKVNFVENEESLLNDLFNLQDLDQFIKDQFGLMSCLEAKVYRYQFEKIIKQTCEEFRKQTNIQINMSLRQDELLKQIQSLNQNEQELYLQQLKIYWSNIYFQDLYRLINSEGFMRQYHEHLLNGNLIAKPKLIGYFGILKQKPFLNHFGFLQSNEEFAQSIKKNSFYHIFYSKCNKQQIAFCKFVEFKKEKYYFQGINRRYNQKSNFSFSLKKIRGAIQYCKEFESICQGQLIFIGNDGQFYLNQDQEILNKMTSNQSLTQFIQLSNQEFQIVFDEQFDEKQLYFNEKNFRLKNMLEKSEIQNYKDYGIQKLKLNQDLIQIDPRQISLKNSSDKPQKLTFGNILTGQALRKLLILFSCLIEPVEKIEYQIPPQNDELSLERKEYFLKDYKIIKLVEGKVSNAGSQRDDELIFYDILNQPITKPVKALNLQCYIQHSILEEVVYHPEIEQKQECYLFQWTPRIKGNYNIFINGMKLNFQLPVKADEPHDKESRIFKQTQEILYFNNVEFQFEIFDFYGNFVSLNDKPIYKIMVQTKDKKIKIKQRYEYKNTYCSIYMTFYNLEKSDNKVDECQLDFLIEENPFITNFTVQLIPQQLTYQRIENFTRQFKFDGQAQLLIRRDHFWESIVQQQHLSAMKKLKISFYEELAVDQGGPTREFFEIFGKELKNNKHQIMKQTLNNPNLYYFDEESSKGQNHINGFLFGYFIAYAMANQFKVGISFALPLWKILFDIPIEFKDLEDFIEPQAYKNYLSLKDMSKEQLESLQLYFVYSIEDKELLPDGKNQQVTQELLDQFLNLTAKYLLQTKHERIIKEFKDGMQIHYSKNLLIEHFTLYELNQLIDTNDYQIDKDQLVKCIKFAKKGQFIQDYVFQFISEADQQTLELFLQFITGSKFVYFEQRDFKIEIQCDLHLSKQRLPISRTCSNLLYVPHYDSYALFKMKLTQALEWGTNFFGQN